MNWLLSVDFMLAGNPFHIMAPLYIKKICPHSWFLIEQGTTFQSYMTQHYSNIWHNFTGIYGTTLTLYMERLYSYTQHYIYMLWHNITVIYDTALQWYMAQLYRNIWHSTKTIKCTLQTYIAQHYSHKRHNITVIKDTTLQS